MAKRATKPAVRIRHARPATGGMSQGTAALVLFSLSVLLSSTAAAAREAGHREVVLFCSFTSLACFVSTFVVLARREGNPRVRGRAVSVGTSIDSGRRQAAGPPESARAAGHREPDDGAAETE